MKTRLLVDISRVVGPTAISKPSRHRSGFDRSDAFHATSTRWMAIGLIEPEVAAMAGQ